jgi:enoyl-CoA hydratase
MYKLHGEGIPANYETIILEKKDNVATLALNRPKKLNVLNKKMVAELESVIIEVAKDRGVRVLVISGGGRGASQV